MNSVNLIGKWASDVTLRYTNSGKAVVTADLAVKDGDSTYYIPVVVWDKQAEAVANFAGAKGRQVGISGKLTTRTYETQDGKKRKVVEVVAQRVDFLDSGKDKVGGGAGIGSELTFTDDESVPF